MFARLTGLYESLAPMVRSIFWAAWGPSVFSYRTCQFQHLLSEYHGRGGKEDENSPSQLGRAIKAFKENSYIGWDDVCLLETAILPLLERTNLVLKEQHLRSRYKAIAESDRYLAYEQAVAELGKSPLGDDTLRQQVAYLAQQLYWTYSVATKGHKIRARVSLLVTYVFIAVLAYLLIHSGSVANPAGGAVSRYYLLISVVCFGAFGAYVSFQRRMSRVRIQSETYLAFLELRASYFDGLSSLFSGALFAVLFVILWQSSTLELVFNQQIVGNILPLIEKDKPAEPECLASITSLFACIKINGIKDFAKLLVMSFLAGFAEKFVPDAIDNLVGQAQSRTR